MERVVDLDPGRLEAVRLAHPGVRCEQDAAAVLEDPAIDAVVVATPMRTHYRLVRDALLAGKHVLCEKPLCETAKEAEELVELAADNDRLLMVGHVFLFNPAIEKLKELVDSGELGGLYYLRRSAPRARSAATRTPPTTCRHDIRSSTSARRRTRAVLATRPFSIRREYWCSSRFATERGDAISRRAGWTRRRFADHRVGSQRNATWAPCAHLTTPLRKGAVAQPESGDFGEFSACPL